METVLCVGLWKCSVFRKALHKAEAGAVIGSESCRRSGDARDLMFPWDLITIKELRFPSVRQSIRSPSCTKHRACLRVSAVPVFSISDFVLPKIPRTRKWSHLPADTHWCLCTKPLKHSPDRMEMFIQTMGPSKGLPFYTKRPITQPDNTIHIVSNKSSKRC